MASDDADAVPVAALFSEVVGQPDAVAALRATARQPVHAYLFVGPSGAGLPAAARAFAAALVCPNGGCATCASCLQALAGTHPDVTWVERTGPSVSVDDARRLVTLAHRRPFGAERQVLVLPDVHLGAAAAPALLKTVEEPPPTAVFVLLADDVPPELATVASRCVTVVFPPVPTRAVADWLVARGVDPERAGLIAEGADGDLDRARLLAEDGGYVERVALWRSIPGRLDGNGATAAALARAVQAAADEALAPLRAQHAVELQRLSDDAEAMGERGVPGRKELAERQAREERRWRTEELRAGLGVLARAYRDRQSDTWFAPGAGGDAVTSVHLRAYQRAIVVIDEAAGALRRNPNETLLLEHVLVELGRLGA